MRVLVTGGGGFIGRFLIPALQAAGHTPVLLVRDGQAGEYGDVAAVSADLRHPDPVRQAVATAAPDVIIHLAAAGVTDPFLPVADTLAHNLHGTLHLLQAAFEQPHPPQRLIVARTPGEQEAINPYAAGKAAAWAFCAMYARTRHWPIVGATIFQAYGPGQPAHTLIPAALRAALAGEDFPMTHGTQQRDWIHARDVAEGLMALVTTDLPPGTTLDLGTGIATPLIDVVRQIYALAGQGGRPLPGALPARPGEVVRQSADVAALARTRTLIPWQPRLSLAAGLATLI
jgi:nucleoside-diphosphate-sugar epimerase